MSDQPNDGGPAFPLPEQRGADGAGIANEWPGMSLRDWFAGQALVGMLTDPHTTASAVIVALDAYIFADAMLAERAKRGAA